MILERIQSPKDLKGLNEQELVSLCAEIRDVLLHTLSTNGGHLAPNLGVVELSVALHYVFDSPKDKIVWDVSHQTYTHKILTGRKDAFLKEGHYHDVSGFSDPDESEHDLFRLGHTASAISLANGLAKGRDMLGGKENVVAIIGDGSLSGGEAYEGLNNVVELGTNTIVIVNDNDHSIAENHGGYAMNLKKLRETNGTSGDNLFKAIGFDYRYVEEGNDVLALIQALKEIKNIDHPILLHIHTIKGKGYPPAEINPEAFHNGGPFDLASGKRPLRKEVTYQALLADYIQKKVKEGLPLVALTSGTPIIGGADQTVRKSLGKNFYDAGIAEEHAAAMASGIAKTGAKVIWTVFASFVQRCYDQLNQDLSLNRSPAVILISGATALSGASVTHLGMFDIPLLANIPGITYLAPVTKEQYFAMLDYALAQNEKPILIRVPAKVISTGEIDQTDYSKISSRVVVSGKDVAIIAVGSFFERGKAVQEALKEHGIIATLIDPVFVSHLDEKTLRSLEENHRLVVTLEDGQLEGGYGEKIARFYGASKMKVLNFGIKKGFYDRVDEERMLEMNSLTVPQIVQAVLNEK